MTEKKQKKLLPHLQRNGPGRAMKNSTLTASG